MAHLSGEAQWQDDDRSGTYKNLWISKENIDYKQGDDICKMYNLSGSERFQPRCTKYNKLMETSLNERASDQNGK